MEATRISYYDQLAAVLALAQLDLSVSEMHGIVCGAICNKVKTGTEPALLELVAAGSDATELAHTVRQPLAELYEQVSAQLHDREAGFALLLPDDDGDVVGRTEALAEWCRGFLLGLLHDHVLAVNELPGEAKESVGDLLAISDMEAWQDDPEDNDWALAEVEEYVRVAVQLVYEELQSEGKVRALH